MRYQIAGVNTAIKHWKIKHVCERDFITLCWEINKRNRQQVSLFPPINFLSESQKMNASFAFAKFA